MSGRLILAGAAVALLWPAGAALAASGPQVACPPTVTVLERADAPDGFQATPGKREAALDNLELYRGPVGQRGEPIKPKHATATGGARTTSWTLDRVPKRVLSMVCRYADTNVTLDSDLGDSITRCELRQSKSGKSTAACR